MKPKDGQIQEGHIVTECPVCHMHFDQPIMTCFCRGGQWFNIAGTASYVWEDWYRE